MSRQIDTKKRFVRCRECRQGIFFAYDGGMPVYVEPDPITPLEEIGFRLQGKMTFVAYGSYLGMRNISNVHMNAAVYVEHPHRNGFDECPTGKRKREIGSNVPPF